MVIVDRKINQEMPVGSTVRDIDNGEILHVTSRPMSSRLFGTMIGLVTDSGQRFEDLAKYYEPFV